MATLSSLKDSFATEALSACWDQVAALRPVTGDGPGAVFASWPAAATTGILRLLKAQVG